MSDLYGACSVCIALQGLARVNQKTGTQENIFGSTGERCFYQANSGKLAGKWLLDVGWTLLAQVY